MDEYANDWQMEYPAASDQYAADRATQMHAVRVGLHLLRIRSGIPHAGEWRWFFTRTGHGASDYYPTRSAALQAFRDGTVKGASHAT